MAKTKTKKNIKQDTRRNFVARKATQPARVKVFVNVEEVLREESVDEFMVRKGVFDKLLSQIENTPRNTDWESELDEL
jgi:hypothetical protein